MKKLRRRWPRRADRAMHVARDAYFAPLHRASVEHEQTPGQGCSRAAQQLERLGCLHGADDADQGGEHAHGGAAGFLERAVGWEDAGVAGCVGAARVIDRDLSVKAYARA